MTPSTGMQYSEEDLCELARRLSAASQRVASSFSMSCTWFMAPVKASVARLVRERDSDHRGPLTPTLDCHSRSQNADLLNKPGNSYLPPQDGLRSNVLAR